MNLRCADTTMERDRGVKLPLYAKDGIPEVWLVNLTDSVVEVYHDRVQGKYQMVQRRDRSEILTFQAFDSVQFSVAQIVGSGKTRTNGARNSNYESSNQRK